MLAYHEFLILRMFSAVLAKYWNLQVSRKYLKLKFPQRVVSASVN